MYVDLLWIHCGPMSIFRLWIHWTSNH